MKTPAINDVDDDVELPEVVTKPRAYPALYTMEIGQSFARPLSEYKKLHSASQACRKTTRRVFALRRMRNGESEVVRIWRVT